MQNSQDMWVPVTTPWHVLKVVDVGTASEVKRSCEYIE